MIEEFEIIYENYRRQWERKNILIEMDNHTRLWSEEQRKRIIGERDTLAFVVYELSVILRGIREND